MKNKGFTLVELMVVIAIMAIVVGVAVNMIQMQDYSDVGRCTRQFNSVLDKLRTEALSKKDRPYLHLFNKNGSIYILATEEKTFNSSMEGKRIANSKIEVSSITAAPQVFGARRAQQNPLP